MDIEKLIEDLRGLLKQYGEKIPYGELVGAPWPYSKAGDLVWPDPEPYFIEQAATTLSTLQAENEKLRADVVRFNDLLASYQNVLVPELRAELEQVREDNKKLCSAMMTIRRSENSERMCAEYRVDYCTALSHQETADLARIVFEDLMREDARMRGPQKED